MKSTSPVLFGIGNPLLDIECHVPQQFLDKYELKPANAILAEEKHLPIYDEIAKSYAPLKYVAGGSAQNSIRCAQWLLKTKKSSVYVGCVGKDATGETLQKSAEADGVLTSYMVQDKVPTGRCAVLLTDKERSMVAHLAAANEYKISHFESEPIQKFLKEAGLYYATSFFLTVSPETLYAIGKNCVAANKPFLMNLSAPFLIDFFAEKMDALLPYGDFIFANETEAVALGKKKGWGEDLKVIAQKLADSPKANDKRPRLVCFTQGGEPAIVSYQGKILEFAPKPIEKKDIVDLNGAGDAYVGGFLAAYAQFRALNVLDEKQLTTCFDGARYAAFEIIQVSGTTLSWTPKQTYDF